jgi:glycosyltransferase involved in cell wall biosynthesis
VVKVTILSDSPLPALVEGAQGRGAGQGATWLPPLAQAFASHRDLDITWLTLGGPTVERADVELLNQRFVVLPHLKATHDSLLSYYPARLRLQRALRALQPDVVHVWGSERCYPSVLKDLGLPSVYSIQGNLTHYTSIAGPRLNRFWQRQCRYEAKWVHHASVVACESPWSAELVRGFWQGLQARVIEWGVHPSFYGVDWNPRPGQPYLLFCGGIDWRKGVDILFDALELLPTRQWTLRLAGDGMLRQELESRGLPKVEWLGNLKWDELQRQMAGAWGLVMPTRADTGPSVVKEARVMGLPVIGSCNGGLRDYIVDGVNGLHVDPLSPAVLAAVMDRFMGDFAEVRRMGTGRLAEDREYFRSERAALAFRDLYHELAQAPA